jgi:Gpi18-like mannosyltransferase
MSQIPSPRRSCSATGKGSLRSARERACHCLPVAVSALLVVVSIYIRYETRAMTNSDMDAHVLQWYAKLQEQGPLFGLGKVFSNYAPPYLYLLALATLTSSVITPITSVKLIAMTFDIYSAFMIYKIVRLQRPQGYLPFLAAAIFFAGPTMLANSAVWGQADSTYTAFLITCLYMLLIDRPLPAVISFSVALSFKPQGVFFAPLLLLMLLWGKIRWYHLLVIPVVYAICMAPAVAFGRTWQEVFTIYARQADSGKALTHNAATVYVFIDRSTYKWLLWPASVVAVFIFLAWVYYTWRTTKSRDVPTIILLALICVTIVPFFLPNMRDRYYYPGDTLSLILAFVIPSLWYIPILYQLFSMLSYSIFLWAAPRTNLQAAALVALFTLILLLRQQALLGDPVQDSISKARRSRAAGDRHT